jgi:ABC-type proline/glycine betaine transport system permease subunit
MKTTPTILESKKMGMKIVDTMFCMEITVSIISVLAGIEVMAYPSSNINQIAVCVGEGGG